MKRSVGLLIAVLLVLLPTLAKSHPLDLSYMRIQAPADSNRVEVELELDVATATIVLPGVEFTPQSVAQHAQAIAAKTFAQAAIRGASGDCAWESHSATISGTTITVRSMALCKASDATRRWSFPFVAAKTISPRYQLMVKQGHGDSERLSIIDISSTDIEIAQAGASEASASVGFAGFVWSGIEHIGVAPDQWRSEDGSLQLPDGIDHILFLFALLLAGGTLWQTVGVTTGFTIGHSITLALAALNVVGPPSSVIEPLIALSIALAAIDAFTQKLQRHRWKIATGFGLIHGFGFAAALSHLDLTLRGKVTALVGYNLGVELGQVVIVIVLMPLIVVAHRYRQGKNAIKACAAATFLLGVYWFVQRIVG